MAVILFCDLLRLKSFFSVATNGQAASRSQHYPSIIANATRSIADPISRLSFRSSSCCWFYLFESKPHNFSHICTCTLRSTLLTHLIQSLVGAPPSPSPSLPPQSPYRNVRCNSNNYQRYSQALVDYASAGAGAATTTTTIVHSAAWWRKLNGYSLFSTLLSTVLAVRCQQASHRRAPQPWAIRLNGQIWGKCSKRILNGAARWEQETNLKGR